MKRSFLAFSIPMTFSASNFFRFKSGSHRNDLGLHYFTLRSKPNRLRPIFLLAQQLFRIVSRFL